MNIKKTRKVKKMESQVTVSPQETISLLKDLYGKKGGRKSSKPEIKEYIAYIFSSEGDFLKKMVISVKEDEFSIFVDLLISNSMKFIIEDAKTKKAVYASEQETKWWWKILKEDGKKTKNLNELNRGLEDDEEVYEENGQRYIKKGVEGIIFKFPEAEREHCKSLIEEKIRQNVKDE